MIDRSEIKKLEKKTKLLRSYIITAITAAGSGHTGGCMSVAEIAAVLYFKVLTHNPNITSVLKTTMSSLKDHMREISAKNMDI